MFPCIAVCLLCSCLFLCCLWYGWLLTLAHLALRAWGCFGSGRCFDADVEETVEETGSELHGLEFWPLLASVTKRCIMFASTVTSRVRPGHRSNKLISSPLNNTSARFCCFTEVLFSYQTHGCSCILSQGACQGFNVFFFFWFSDIFDGSWWAQLSFFAYFCVLRVFCLCVCVSYKANGWVAWFLFDFL